MLRCLFIQQLYSLSDEQLASIITSDPGHAKSDTPREEEAETRLSKYGTLAKKGTKFYFGYKHHGAMDEDFGMIRTIEVTTAKVHDSQVNLANEGEVRYADKGLFRCEDKRVRCCHEKSHKWPSPIMRMRCTT
jgi:transposase, IS5 family